MTISKNAQDIAFLMNYEPRWAVRTAEISGDDYEDVFQYSELLEDIEYDYKKNEWPEVKRQAKELKREIMEADPNMRTTTRGNITEEMIERAREYPISELAGGSKYWAQCPFHNDKHPSMYLKNNFYYCFVCGETGDTIDLVMKTHNVDFKTAVKLLNYVQ